MSIRRSTAAFITYAALAAGTSVALAAFAAHGLKNIAPTGEQGVIWFTQASEFQMNQALGIVLVALLSEHIAEGLAHKVVQLGTLLLSVSIIFFSGALYSGSFNGPIFFAPWGGTSAMLGWLTVAVGTVLAVTRGDLSARLQPHPAE